MAVLEIPRTILPCISQSYTAPEQPTFLLAHQLVNELETVGSKIGSLKRDAERATEAVTLGQKSLIIARQQAVDAKKLLNPLNHPKVKALLGK